MAIKNLIARGIGFAPGSISYIPTLGFSISAFVELNPTPPPGTKIVRQAQRPAIIGHDPARVSKLMHTERVSKIVK